MMTQFYSLMTEHWIWSLFVAGIVVYVLIIFLIPNSKEFGVLLLLPCLAPVIIGSIVYGIRSGIKYFKETNDLLRYWWVIPLIIAIALLVIFWRKVSPSVSKITWKPLWQLLGLVAFIALIWYATTLDFTFHFFEKDEVGTVVQPVPSASNGPSYEALVIASKEYELAINSFTANEKKEFVDKGANFVFEPVEKGQSVTVIIENKPGTPRFHWEQTISKNMKNYVDRPDPKIEGKSVPNGRYTIRTTSTQKVYVVKTV